MIKANHKTWARLFFNPFIRYLFKRHFNDLYLLNDCPDIPDEAGLILTPNHFSWWDGFFIDLLIRKTIRRRLFILMLEEQLKIYWFFRKLGAFSINRSNPKGIVNTIYYSKNLLINSENVLVFYPQGEIEDYEKHPFTLKQGLKQFIDTQQNTPYILPVAFKIKYSDARKADVYCRFGPLLTGKDVVSDFAAFQNEFNNNIDLLNNSAPDKTVMKGIL
jgi:1-acyl-sn-glycerol-3-phosphate acyltransferase